LGVLIVSEIYFLKLLPQKEVAKIPVIVIVSPHPKFPVGEGIKYK